MQMLISTNMSTEFTDPFAQDNQTFLQNCKPNRSGEATAHWAAGAGQGRFDRAAPLSMFSCVDGSYNPMIHQRFLCECVCAGIGFSASEWDKQAEYKRAEIACDRGQTGRVETEELTEGSGEDGKFNSSAAVCPHLFTKLGHPCVCVC